MLLILVFYFGSTASKALNDIHSLSVCTCQNSQILNPISKASKPKLLATVKKQQMIKYCQWLKTGHY